MPQLQPLKTLDMLKKELESYRSGSDPKAIVAAHRVIAALYFAINNEVSEHLLFQHEHESNIQLKAKIDSFVKSLQRWDSAALEFIRQMPALMNNFSFFHTNQIFQHSLPELHQELQRILAHQPILHEDPVEVEDEVEGELENNERLGLHFAFVQNNRSCGKAEEVSEKTVSKSSGKASRKLFYTSN